MGYWDFAPPSWGRTKPLTKKELRKMQDAYKQADIISLKVRQQEQEEEKKTNRELDTLLSSL